MLRTFAGRPAAPPAGAGAASLGAVAKLTALGTARGASLGWEEEASDIVEEWAAGTARVLLLKRLRTRRALAAWPEHCCGGAAGCAPACAAYRGLLHLKIARREHRRHEGGFATCVRWPPSLLQLTSVATGSRVSICRRTDRQSYKMPGQAHS